jgi:hypothetical protein
MAMSQDIKWRDYERIIGELIANNSDLEVSVTRNAKIKGHITGVWRQIDVLIDARWEIDFSRRIVIEAKYYRRKLNVKDIEAFEGMLKDCGASRGIIFCPNGYSEAALKRAQDKILIQILSKEAIEETWWSNLERCFGSCSSHGIPPSKQGVILWGGEHLLGIGGAWEVTFTGKCDVCHDFVVWCWGCGDRFGVSHDETYE